ASILTVNTPLSSLSFGATGPLAPTGGWVNAPMTDVQTDLADAELLVSVAMGSGQQAESEAAVGSLVLLPGTAYNVTADFAMSRAFPTCSGGSGDTSIANLQVGGVHGTVTGPPNQVVDGLGAESTFGLVAYFKPGGTTPNGELEYTEHESSQFSNVHSIDDHFYTSGTTNNSRVFGGDAQVNHV